jgi:hypothetical protein
VGTIRSSQDGCSVVFLYETVLLFFPERGSPAHEFLLHYRKSIIFLVSTRLSVCSR